MDAGKELQIVHYASVCSCPFTVIYIDDIADSIFKRYLDEDIMEKLTAPSWVDYIAAGCLQILREIDKK